MATVSSVRRSEGSRQCRCIDQNIDQAMPRCSVAAVAHLPQLAKLDDSVDDAQRGAAVRNEDDGASGERPAILGRGYAILGRGYAE